MRIIAKKDDIFSYKTNALVLGFFEKDKIEGKFKDIDEKLGNEISYLLRSKEFKGELEEVVSISTHGKLAFRNLIIVGLGKKKGFNSRKLRRAACTAINAVKSRKMKKFTTLLHHVDVKDSAQAITESFVLGLYNFDNYKSEKDDKKEIKEVAFLEDDNKGLRKTRKGIKKGKIIADNVNGLRDLVNEPAQKINPSYLAHYARQIARGNNLIKVKVFKKDKIKKMKMGGLLGVSKGGGEDPRFIILEYEGSKDKPIVFVGKGVTFDSGGLDIKPDKYMKDMRSDMAGAATVLQTLKTAAELGIKKHIVAIAPACENMPGSKAFKQGDVLKSYNGKTIEIGHTDAEGRLILADALGYAEKNYDPDAIIDIATLTGASIIALGYNIASLLGNDDNLKDDIKKAAEKADEYVWELPIIEEYKDLMKSDFADVSNMSKERLGPGVITAAIFLENFIDKTRWAHVDIGAAGWSPKNKGCIKKGGTGHCLKTFIAFLEK